MKPFNELIKNYDKIRPYLRDFTVYGYKTREDFDKKSLRTYDNEKRRIQSYLSPYLTEQISTNGKRLGINFDYLSITANPLYDSYKTKSFTKNDIMLHFIILDLLQTYSKLTLPELYDHLTSDYLDQFEDYKLLDQRTLRIKVNEYVENGLIHETKEEKVTYYQLAVNPLDTLPEKTKVNLFTALNFYQNVYPLGLLGDFILEQYHGHKPYFSFSSFHFSHAVDELIFYKLLTAITSHTAVTLHHVSKNTTSVLPLKLVDNVEQGRRYILCYHLNDHKYKFYRLDRILDVILLPEPIEKSSFLQRQRTVTALLDATWGVALAGMDTPRKLEKWELILHIDEKEEASLITQFEQAHENGILQRVGIDTFSYTLSILDANEAVPWLRQFVGRIISINCTNKLACTRFINDIKLMKSYYEED